MTITQTFWPIENQKFVFENFYIFEKIDFSTKCIIVYFCYIAFRLKKVEEARHKRKVEREQAKRRLQLEIQENKDRRTQLKESIAFFEKIQQTIDAIKSVDDEQNDWEKYMRCNGLPNTNCPGDLRKYIHQWQSDIEKRKREARNWLLRTDERSLLTQDISAADLTKATLRKQQGNAGDIYAARTKEVLGVRMFSNKVFKLYLIIFN